MRRLLALMRRRRGLLLLSVVCGTVSALLSLTPYVAAALALAALGPDRADWPRLMTLLAVIAIAGGVTVLGVRKVR